MSGSSKKKPTAVKSLPAKPTKGASNVKGGQKKFVPADLNP